MNHFLEAGSSFDGAFFRTFIMTTYVYLCAARQKMENLGRWNKVVYFIENFKLISFTKKMSLMQCVRIIASASGRERYDKNHTILNILKI